MKKFSILLLLLVLKLPGLGAVLAGPYTNQANRHVYYLLEPDTWTNSEAAAVALGGHLVTINDAAENQWVVETFAQYGGISRPLWIGLTDRDREGRFRWVSGEAVSYTNWNTASLEPNNSGGSGYEEDFAYIIQDNSGNPTVLPTFWNDVPDDGYGVIPPICGVVEVDPLAPPITVQTQVCWPTVAGYRYQAQWRPAGSKWRWMNFGEPVTGTGASACVNGPPRVSYKPIYRVVVLDSDSTAAPD